MLWLPRIMYNKLLKFSYVGVANTVIGYAVIFSALAAGFSPYISNLAGYCIGIICSFYLNKIFVFSDGQSGVRAAPKYLIAFLISYSLNLFVLYIGEQVSFNIYAAQVVAGGAYFLSMFLLSKTWVFE